MPLAEVEQYVWTHHHLPGVISQQAVEAEGGVDLTAFTVQLQEKLEELYLHAIELDKRLQTLGTENAALRTQVGAELEQVETNEDHE